MLLNQLVEINQEAFISRAVSFNLMNTDKNLKLCKGFIFNHDTNPTRAKNTSVGILDAIRRSFHSSSEPNVHLIVQEYGKGKSHFALTVANFFKLSHESEEVQGILNQLKRATSENSTIFQTLKAYKERGKHLVVCLSAADVTDMRKHFFQELNKELKSHDVTDAIAQKICREPLQFLENLDNDKRQEADKYLIKNFSMTVVDIERRMTENDFQAIDTVKKLCFELTGINPDFSSSIQIGEIIDDLVNKLCKGENAPFQGILILFDELYEYLRNWVTDTTGTGGLFLQNITDACDKHQGKIAFVSLTQKTPSGITVSAKNSEDYKRIVSRIDPNTYNPKASLELVLDGLLNQLESNGWESFLTKWRNDLNRKSLDVFSKKQVQTYYNDISWKHEDFYRHLAIGCFPLHPLTSYLLCNLSFAQGRSVIDFIQQEVKEFISNQAVEKNGLLNLIYPIALVDAFESNFANPEANTEYITVFSDYKSSLNIVQKSSDVDPDEIAVLKALLLFWTSGAKLQKTEEENHEELLQSLTGLSKISIAKSLEKLTKVREVIYHNLAEKTYRFHQAGKGIDELRHRIREEAKHKQFFIDDVEKHFNDNIGVYTSGKGMTIPQQFVDVKRLRTEDWFFQNKVFSIKNLRSLLQKNQPFKTSDQSGIVAYVIAETSEEILLLEKDIMKLIEKHPYRDQFAVAIAERPIEELAQLMLEQQAADKFKPQEFGAALSQLKGQYAKQIENETKLIFKSVEFYSHIIEDIPQGDKTNISIIISEILEQSYSLIPPIEGSDKLYLKSAKGSSGNAFIAKRILEDDLRPESLEAAYKGIVEVYVKSWGLLRFSLKIKKYEVVIPTQKDVRKAWDKISALTDLGEESDKITQLSNVWEVLSSPPYGYNAYTFTILLTGWMAYHRSEVFIEGSFGIPQKKSEQIRVKIEPVKSWVSTNILDKPKEFISEWILKSRPRIIRRKPSLVPELHETYDYDLARQKSEDISDFVANSGTPDKYQNLVDHQQFLATACSRIEQSFEPAVKIEMLIESISISSWADVSEFVDLYSDLQSPLINFAENGLTVICTTEQQRRYTQALQSALEKIEAAIEIESDRLAKLATEEDCGGHKANLTQAINRLNQVENLPDHFVVSLQKSLNDTEQVRDQITTKKKTDECVAQIQVVCATLSDTAITQQGYARMQEHIDVLASKTPTVKETDIYCLMLENIGEKQDFLIQQLSQWESQYSISMSNPQASKLKEQLISQRFRYTDESSKERLQDLLKRLEGAISGGENEGDHVALLSNAKGKINDIKTLRNPLDSMKSYLQLCEIKLPVNSRDDTSKRELEEIKSQGKTALTQTLAKIKELCKHPPKDYVQQKRSVGQLQNLADSSDELMSFRTTLNEISQELDKQNTLLQKQHEDNRIMQVIRLYSLSKANTLCLCEEAISEISTEQQKLNSPDAHTEEIERQVRAFQDKVNNHRQSLKSLQEDLLSAIDSSQLTSIRAKYHRLEHIFRSSSQFVDYQQFESQIDLLDDDIKVIVQLQDLGSSDRANSLETCDRVIYQIDHGKTTLHEPERFSVKLQDLKNTLLQRKQSYLSKLTEFRDGLSNAATTKEAKEVRQQIGKDLSLYQNSEEFLNYESISKESEDLIGLLQIFESQEIETPENCVAEIAKLQQWQDTNPDIASTLRSRVEFKLEELENKRQELQIVGRRLAESWFNRTQQKIVTVREIAEQSEKFSSSSNLIKQITKEISKHEDLLDQSQKGDLEQYLEEANAFCDEIKRLDREEKIIAQFQELPIAQRASLYERLANYLNNAEEEES